MMNLALLKRIDFYLLPRNLSEPFSPYVWLIYLPFFFVPVILFHESMAQLGWMILICLAFLFLYFASYWLNAQQVIWTIAGMVLLSIGGGFLTPSASTIMVYAAAMCCLLKSRQHSFIGLGSVLTITIIASWLLGFGFSFYMPALVFSLIIGLLTIYQHALQEKKQELILSRQETQRLTKVAERERIARDLHDLIGHTFSVITLKADLAGRLLDKGTDKDLAKARQEIKQLETISRDALSQVREVVSGYRSSDLLSELANAKNVFSSLNIEFDYQLQELTEVELESALTINKELAIVLRELVTNIIKHAKASKVSVIVKKHQQGLVLLVQDDGQGMASEQTAVMGFGLLGIHERINKLKGWVKLTKPQGTKGTLSEIYVPLNPISI
jgi:two-component system, NarL family, sensor histidine kinase DesK